MINIFSACTSELDNPEKAVRDIIEGLNSGGNLLKNSAALVFSHAKFIEAGIVTEVCKRLPPCTAGITSQFIALPAQSGELLLTVTVMTSNDTEFAAAVSGPLSVQNVEESIDSLYRETAASLGGDPSLAFAFPSTINEIPTDIIANALRRFCGTTPVFGSFSLDMDKYIRNPRIIFQSESYSDRLAILLIKSPVQPRFYSYPFPEVLTFDQDIVVTEADGSLIHTINNIPALEFMQEAGLIPDKNAVGILAIPLIASDPEGTESQIMLVKAAAPNGGMICTHQVKTGMILNIGNVSAEFVMESAQAMINDICSNPGGSAVFVFSCFLRSVVLGGPPIDEFNMIRNKLDDLKKPYLFVSSGGELCPYRLESGESVNRMYTYAIVACQF